MQVYFTLAQGDHSEVQRTEQSLARVLPDADGRLQSLVYRTLAGQDSGEEQALVAFDRALATSGEACQPVLAEVWCKRGKQHSL